MSISKAYHPLPQDLVFSLDSFFKGYAEDSSLADFGIWMPVVDITEEEHRFLLIADLSGVNKQDITISLHNKILTLQGERKNERKNPNSDYSAIEQTKGQFYRRFSLPKTADETQITAKYQHEVLEIVIVKKELSGTQFIEITSDE